MRKVLILSNAFSPHAATESARWTQLSKYLPEYGWQPVVICSRWNAGNCARYDPAFGGEEVKNFVAATVPPPPDLAEPTTLSEKIRKGIGFAYGFRHPRAWSDAVLKLVPTILTQNRIEIVVATFPIRAPLYVAHRIHRKWKIPWIADFRDVLEERRAGWRLRWERRREERVVRSAAALLTVSSGLASVLKSRHNQEIHVLPNGYDPDEFSGLEPVASDRFTIVHTGTLEPPGSTLRASPRVLVEALLDLVGDEQVKEDDLEVVFYGASEQVLGRHLEGLSPRFRVRAVPWLRRPEILRYQQGATLLLLLAASGQRGIMTSKVYEYLRAGRPILSIPQDGGCVDELLARTGAGRSASTRPAIRKELHEAYLAWKQGSRSNLRMKADSSEIVRYDRRNQAGELATILARFARSRHARSN